MNRQASMEMPDGGVTSYVYDLRGALVEVNDPNTSRFVLVRDRLGRLLERQIARGTGVIGTTSQEFEYDRLGRLVLAADDNGGLASVVCTYVYDAASRLVTESQKIGDGPSRTVASSYTALDRTGLAYPSGKQVAFAYTARHQLDTVVVDSVTLADYTYSPAGAVTAKTLGNGIVMSETLDSLYRVAGREYRKDGNLRVGFGYGYDAVGMTWRVFPGATLCPPKS